MAAKQFTDVSFVFIDGYPVGEEADVKDSPALKNIAGVAFKEEQCGYLAGYAAVKEGYTKLGFTGGGGGDNPACCRYGYGFVQGADAAAKELNEKVEMNYSWQYGANFSASPELQTMAAGWYQAGTEVIFACGGSMFASVAAAAGAEEGKVVGVDVDQSGESPTVITSAMKGLCKGTCVRSITLMTSTMQFNCFLICSKVMSSLVTQIVMRETSSCSVVPTVRLCKL